MWNDAHHENDESWWDDKRATSAWVAEDHSYQKCDTGLGANVGKDKNRRECIAFQYFKHHGEREWCTRLQKQMLGLNQFDGFLDQSTVTHRGQVLAWQQEHGCVAGEWAPPD